MPDLSSLKELGTAGIAIGALSYISFQLIKQLSEARQHYESFVMDNNHTTTALVREAATAMKENADAIRTHTEISKQILGAIMEKK